MTCPNCGHATPPTNAARCGHCNFKLPATPMPQAAKPAATLPCWNCRHPNAAEAERCEHCNAKLRRPDFTVMTDDAPKPVNASTRKPVNAPNHDE